MKVSDQLHVPLPGKEPWVPIAEVARRPRAGMEAVKVKKFQPLPETIIL
jgi:hypothetical protein